MVAENANRNPRPALNPAQIAEKRLKADEKKKTAAADRDGVAFIAMSKEAKVLAWNAEQLDLMVRKIRANNGGLGRIPSAKADAILDMIAAYALEGHLLNERVLKLVKLADRNYRYLPHTDLRKLQENSEKVAAVAKPAQPAQPQKTQKAQKVTMAAAVNQESDEETLPAKEDLIQEAA